MSKYKLLLADDSVTIQKVVNLTFADEGIEVITVGDGNSAMEKFIESTPDLVMADVNMPGLDGYRICEIIKQDDKTKNVPVILLVGSFEPFNEEEARRVGANDYLTKPFQSIRQLVNKVTVLLNKSNGNQVSVQPQAENPPMEMPVQKQVEEVSEPLGDPGMDDEMIQANQIGSFPVNDIQKLESVSDFEINLPQNQLKSPAYESFNQLSFEDNENFGKTQPLSAEEFKELTLTPAAETSESEKITPIFSDDRVSAEEKAISLEKQMVSEFESESKQIPSEFETQVKESNEYSVETLSPELIAPEEIFAPEEIPVEQQVKVEEVLEEKGFAIQEVKPVEELTPQLQRIEEADTILEELYDPPKESEIEETVGQSFYVEPQTAKVEEFAEPKAAEVQEIAASELFNEPIGFSNADTFEDQVFSEPEVRTNTSYETGQNYEVKEEIANWEKVEETPSFQSEIVDNSTFDNEKITFEEPETINRQPTYFQEEKTYNEPQITIETEENSQQVTKLAEPIQFYPVEQFFDRNQPATDNEAKSETQQVSNSEQIEVETQPESKYIEQEQESEPSYTESETVAEPEQPVVTENEVSPTTFDTAQSFFEETATPTVEIPVPLPTIEEEIPSFEEVETEEQPLEEPEEEEQPLEIEPKEETKQAKVDSLVTKKEKSEAVESVIVSEFARHSISLSSEAVETIASRIADKISEKIIQQLADDVVGSLADLIVEKMERKKLG